MRGIDVMFSVALFLIAGMIVMYIEIRIFEAVYCWWSTKRFEKNEKLDDSI